MSYRKLWLVKNCHEVYTGVNISYFFKFRTYTKHISALLLYFCRRHISFFKRFDSTEFTKGHIKRNEHYEICLLASVWDLASGSPTDVCSLFFVIVGRSLIRHLLTKEGGLITERWGQPAHTLFYLFHMHLSLIPWRYTIANVFPLSRMSSFLGRFL